ncbi:hypothetical protein K431DRAFT_337633 [Polychaeton citri CBS 116435]|uniref:Protein kinase domain-containing protein n=1 Tax=Polychaeton citri CBS 116435 TaxID=1314669 RepID=A0A9P4QDP9_9PEZI|nr:hypothetical protein K431DRAFT_337633 [Polychaeton citri CBS 116435]
MSERLGKGETSCHLIDFFRDELDVCALTVFRHNVRFHILADPEQISDHSTRGEELLSSYRRLLNKLKISEGETDACVTEEAGSLPCRDGEVLGQSEGSDSGVDVTYRSPDSSTSCGPDDSADAALRDWMLLPCAKDFISQAPAEGQPSHLTLDQWYHCKTLFYTLKTQDGNLAAVEEKKTKALEERITALIPCLQLPKYILGLKIPLIKASELELTQTSDSPAPFHPSGAKIGSRRYFVKLVDVSDPQPTKRELHLLKRIEKLGLNKQFNVPLVEGLIAYGNRKNQIMGFLQTEIIDPKPLTQMLDSKVPQDKRDAWAREAKRIKDILHENRIVWGDAKADNFMVDKHDKLWIIDFGGSYTEGWIDPELSETREGDDMGVERIANGLHDPDANTYSGEEETMETESAFKDVHEYI